MCAGPVAILTPSAAAIAVAGPHGAGDARCECTGGPARAVFFDVDFTLIHPGPTFHGVGYRDPARATATVDPEASTGPSRKRRRCSSRSKSTTRKSSCATRSDH